MRIRSIAAGLGAVALVLAAGTALAQQTQTPRAGHLSFGVKGGIDFVVDGDVHDGVDAPVADLGGLNPDLAGVAATLQIESRDYDDVYGELWSYAAEIGWGLDSQSEIFAIVSYTDASGDQLQVGTAAVPALNAELPVLGSFDDFTAWGIEAGYRQYYPGQGGIIPYAGIRGGIQFVDSIGASFSIPDAGIALNDVAFYGSSEVITAGLEIGAVIPISAALAIGVETGVTWTDDLSDDDADIAGLGLGSINDEGGRISIPIRAVLRGRF